MFERIIKKRIVISETKFLVEMIFKNAEYTFVFNLILKLSRPWANALASELFLFGIKRTRRGKLVDGSRGGFEGCSVLKLEN